jgi:hypothetical protein
MFFVLLCLIIKWNSFFTWWSAWYDLIVYFWTNGCPSFHEILLCFRVAYGVLGRAHDRPAFAVEYSRMHFGPHHCFEPNYGTFPTILLWFIVFPCKIRSRVIKHIARLVSFGVAVLNYCLSELADDLFIDEIQFVLYAHLRRKKLVACSPVNSYQPAMLFLSPNLLTHMTKRERLGLFIPIQRPVMPLSHIARSMLNPFQGRRLLCVRRLVLLSISLPMMHA